LIKPCDLRWFEIPTYLHNAEYTSYETDLLSH
jgi:hypothetical protein